MALLALLGHPKRDALLTKLRLDDCTRRSIERRACCAVLVASCAAFVSSPVFAQPDQKGEAIAKEIKAATDTLQTLLDNWQNAVIDCTYADVPRELLEQKNKALLLEKASTMALFDKSVSVVSCKTVVTNVRQYLGRTGVGPLATLDGTLKDAIRVALDNDENRGVDVDTLVQMVEEVQRELIKADSLSYAARRDFSAMNNFDPELQQSIMYDDKSSNLLQCKLSIERVVDMLELIQKLLLS